MHFSSLTALLAAFFISGASAAALNKNSMAAPPVDALAARKAKKPTCDITSAHQFFYMLYLQCLRNSLEKSTACDGALGTPSAVSSCVTAVAGLNKPAGSKCYPLSSPTTIQWWRRNVVTDFPFAESDTSASALQCLLLANLGIITLVRYHPEIRPISNVLNTFAAGKL